jgi:transcriptional regulator with XRE-family HTH domain
MNISELRSAREKWPVSERGKAARRFRERLGLTVAQLAQRVSCSKQSVFTFERGVTNPSEDLELKLTNALIAELAERRARPSEEAPLEAVYGPVNLQSFIMPESGEPQGSEAYRQAIRVLMDLAVEREDWHVLAYAARCKAAAAELGSLAEKAHPRESSLILAFKYGLEAEVGEIRKAGQKTPPPSETSDSYVPTRQSGSGPAAKSSAAE